MWITDYSETNAIDLLSVIQELANIVAPEALWLLEKMGLVWVDSVG